MRRMIILIGLLAIALSACGTAAPVADLGTAPSAVTTSATSEPAPDADEAVAARTTAAAAPGALPAPARASADTPQTAAGEGALPGTPVDWADRLNTHDQVGVTGVEADDVLNVRARPGADQPIVERLAPLRTGLRLTGAARLIGDSAWLEIDTGSTAGWVNSAFVDLVAGTTDITADLRAAGVMPHADSMRDMADAVLIAGGYAANHLIVWGPHRVPDAGAEEQRRVVISGGPAVGDLGEITIDVVDTFDDSVSAERLTIFAAPASDGTLRLRTVERTYFCDLTRGGGEVCA